MCGEEAHPARGVHVSYDHITDRAAVRTEPELPVSFRKASFLLGSEGSTLIFAFSYVVSKASFVFFLQG